MTPAEPAPSGPEWSLSRRGLHLGAILAEDDPAGWAKDVAVVSPWTPNLRVVPAARGLSNREKDQGDHVEMRLTASLDGLDADLVVIDCPNRQGGPLIQNALNAADSIVYASRLDEDGIDGVDGAVTTVRRFHAAQERRGLRSTIHEAGIIVGAVRDVVMSRNARRALVELREAYPGLVLDPLVPERVIVGEARAARDCYGNYDKGRDVHQAYEALAKQVIRT